MELKITEIQEIKPVSFNYDELKETITRSLSHYQNAVYTEETVKEAKQDRATLNKLYKAINDKKIEIKKQCLKPYEDFEIKIKEILALIDKPVMLIDMQIKGFEETQKFDKAKKIEQLFNDIISNSANKLGDIFTLGHIFEDKWLNATIKLKDIEAEIQASVDRLTADFAVIEGLGSEFEIQLKDLYLRTRDLTKVMQEKSRLEEQKVKLEAVKVPAIKLRIVSANLEVERATETEEDEPETEIEFKVWVTAKQLTALKEFLVNNNIKYGKVGN